MKYIFATIVAALTLIASTVYAAVPPGYVIVNQNIADWTAYGLNYDGLAGNGGGIRAPSGIGYGQSCTDCDINSNDWQKVRTTVLNGDNCISGVRMSFKDLRDESWAKVWSVDVTTGLVIAGSVVNYSYLGPSADGKRDVYHKDFSRGYDEVKVVVETARGQIPDGVDKGAKGNGNGWSARLWAKFGPPARAAAVMRLAQMRENYREDRRDRRDRKSDRRSDRKNDNKKNENNNRSDKGGKNRK